MTVIAHVDDSRLQGLLADLEKRGRNLDPVLEDVGKHMVNTSIPLNFREGGRPEKWKETGRGGRVLYRRGRLAGSINHVVRGGRLLKIGTSHRGARLHQLGGEVKPVRAKALTIPLPGVKASAKRYKNTFLITKNASGDHVGVIAQRVGKKKIRALFLLRSRAEIDARPYLLFQAEDITYAEERTVEHMGLVP